MRKLCTEAAVKSKDENNMMAHNWCSNKKTRLEDMKFIQIRTKKYDHI